MSFTPPDPFTTHPELRGTSGGVASTHWLATAAGQSVLERGGTAIDAAVATAFVLHVVEPHLNGPGGDLTAILALEGAAPIVVSGQGAAPAAATIEHYAGEGLDEVPGAGFLAAAVPGAVPAWLDLLAEHGTWELADVLAPALRYARDGHPIQERVVATLRAVRELFEGGWPSSAALWLPDGRLPEPGELVRNAEWAATIERMLAAGAAESDRVGRIAAARAEWDGPIAAEIEAFVRHPLAHSDGRAHAGVLTAADTAAHRTRLEQPVALSFRGVDVAKAGPWTQGPVLLQTLAILDGMPDERLDPSTALGIHTIAEALKLALADRDAWYGDPDAADVPLAELIDPAYAAERRALIGEVASAEFRPGSPGGRAPWVPAGAVGAAGSSSASGASSAASSAGSGSGATGEPTVGRDGATRGDTCHLDVIDRWGTLVSATPSGGWLQSSPAIPGLGFCLGTRLQMTWLDPASPSALRPGVRPRSTLSPTMLLRDGAPAEALGTPGGDQQDQWQLLYLLRRIVGGYAPQAAIDAPASHVTDLVSSFAPRVREPAGLVVESRVGDDVIAELRRRGHEVAVAGPWTLGRLSAVGVDPRGGVFAASNPRGGQGYAAVS